MVLSYEKSKVGLAAITLYGDVVWMGKLVLNLNTGISNVNA